MLGNLTPKGLEEHKLIARRMSSRFSRIFNSRNRNVIDAYSSTVRRCIMSMAGSTATLMQLHPSLELRLTSDNRAFEFTNNGHAVSRESKKYYLPYQEQAVASQVDWTGVKDRVFRNPSLVEASDFEMGRDILCFWAICQDIETVHIDILDYLTLDQVYNNWRLRSGFFYLMFARAKEFGTDRLKGMAPLVLHFVNQADEAIATEKVAATLRYGHDTTLMPLAAALGLEDFSKDHSMTDLPTDYWDTASKICMGSNLQTVFYRNKAGEVIVKILYNEKETHIPALEPDYAGVYYKWENLREYWLKQIGR